MSDTRRVYSIQQLLRLRPARPRQESASAKVRRSSPVAVPRRRVSRSPSPEHTPRQSPTFSPPALSQLSPTRLHLTDGPNSYNAQQPQPQQAQKQTQQRSPGSPLMPPGFAPMRANGTSGPRTSPTTTRERLEKRRMPLGPDLSNNFASRIAFARASKRETVPTVVGYADGDVGSAKVNDAVAMPAVDERDDKVSFEIDQLFADFNLANASTSALDAPTSVSGDVSQHSASPATSISKGVMEEDILESNGLAADDRKEATGAVGSLVNGSPPESRPMSNSIPFNGSLMIACSPDGEHGAMDLTFEQLTKRLVLEANGMRQEDDVPRPPETSPSIGVIHEPPMPKDPPPERGDIASLTKWFRSIASECANTSAGADDGMGMVYDGDTRTVAEEVAVVEEDAGDAEDELIVNGADPTFKVNGLMMGGFHEDPLSSDQGVEAQRPFRSRDEVEELDSSVLSFFDSIQAQAKGDSAVGCIGGEESFDGCGYGGGGRSIG